MINILRLLSLRLKRNHKKYGQVTGRVISGWCFVICNKITIDDIFAMLVALRKLDPEPFNY